LASFGRIDNLGFVDAGSKLTHLAEVKVTHLCDEQARLRGVFI